MGCNFAKQDLEHAKCYIQNYLGPPHICKIHTSFVGLNTTHMCVQPKYSNPHTNAGIFDTQAQNYSLECTGGYTSESGTCMCNIAFK